MHLTVDRTADMGYIELTELGESRSILHTEPLAFDLPNGSTAMVNLDFDQEGRLIGIEVFAASLFLPKSLLAASKG